MLTKDEWVKQFETLNGRKPTAEEFMAAKDSEFTSEQVSGRSTGVASTSTGLESPQQSQVGETDPVAKGQAVFSLVLPVLAMVFGLIFAALSYFVAPAWLFVILSFLAAGLAVLSLVMSFMKRGKKVLASVATGVTGLMVFVSLGGLIFQIVANPTNNLDQVNRTMVEDDEEDDSTASSSEENRADSTDINDYIDKEVSFDWTEAKFQKLKVSKETLKDIMKTYGKANEGEISDDTLRLTYKGSSASEFVQLRFDKQYDGTFLLKSANASFNQDFVSVDSRNYVSDWTKEQYDALVADDEDIEKGTKLEEVIKDHSIAYNATYTLSTYEEGDFTKKLNLTYADYKAPEDKLERVYLRFEYEDDDNSFHLASKSGPKED